MLITVFTIRRKDLIKKYSQIEIQEKHLELLYYSAFFKLAHKRGRPRIIWHEWVLDEIVDQAIRYAKSPLKDLDYNQVFNRKWIESKEFKHIVDKAEDFLTYGFGE